MFKRSYRLALALLLVLILVASVTAGCAKKYPNKPITIIAPAGPGGGWDLTARSVSKVLADTKLVSVATTVENQAGGGGGVALANVVQNKKGDGYTLVVYSPPLILINLNGQSKFGYKDITPLARLTTDYQIIAVSAKSKYKTLKDVMDALKKDPKSLTVGGASAPGSMDHLSFMLAASKAGVNVKDVPYVSFPDGSQLMSNLISGKIDVASTGVGETLGQLEAKTVIGLAVTAPKRYTDPRLKDVPTLKESGIDVTFDVWRGIFGPPDMPADAKAYISKALENMVKSTNWKKDVLEKYNWIDAYLPGDQFKSFLDEQNKALGDLLKTLGLIK